MRDNVPVIGSVHAASNARPVHRLINELTGTRLRPQNDVHTFVTGRRSIVGCSGANFVRLFAVSLSFVRRFVVASSFLGRRKHDLRIGSRRAGIEARQGQSFALKPNPFDATAGNMYFRTDNAPGRSNDVFYSTMLVNDIKNKKKERRKRGREEERGCYY